MSLKPGIYEQIVNEETEEKLSGISKDNKKLEKIDSGTSSIVLSQYVKDVVRKALEKTDNLDKQVKLANEIIDMVSDKVRTEDLKEKKISTDGNTLLEVKDPVSKLVVNSKNRPATSLTHSYLFTGDVDMPLINELKREIATSDSVDMLISFLKVSGLAMIREALKAFTARGGRLRVITTTYMGATDARAIQELVEDYPNTEVHISYDSKHTRLHAKSYIFHRKTGFHTAYIGSSNLSRAAITDGREWNVKITSHDQPDVFDQMNETFEIYWNSLEFVPFRLEDLGKLTDALNSERYHGKESAISISSYSFDINPYPFQNVILEKLAAERRYNNHTRNLVVAATGTGKTVIAAFDYKRFRAENRGQINRLLFVAHREEILKQSISCFRGVLRDPNFGDILTGNYRPEQLNYLFASIQSINSKDFVHRFPPNYYDFIIVDEFHKAAAESYQDLLTYFKPKILLGLTATPERMDGADILKYFDGNHIAAEIRLPEAIERQLLCPFHYYGIDDGTDLRSLKWSRGGYEESELDNIYVFSTNAAKKRAELIINSIPRYVESHTSVKCIGFCVSIAHAEFMAKFFNDKKIPSMALSSKSSEEERSLARHRLESGEINYIFVVDLYNEGVDIPDVNMVMFLRPTQSLTIFLQQLGRGLRVSDGKEFLTVLDFIGQSNKKYRFADKFKALLDNTKRGIVTEIKEGFVSVPKGCYIELEKKPQEIILANIRSQLGSKEALVESLREMRRDTSLSLSLEHFLNYTRTPVRDLYKYSSFNKLCIAAGLRPDVSEPLDGVMESAFSKFAFADSRNWINCILKFLKSDAPVRESDCNWKEKAFLNMFMITLYMKPTEGMTAERAINEVKECPAIRQELIELLEYRLQQVDFIAEPVQIEHGNVLDCYCTYNRDQILASLGFLKPAVVMAGVYYVRVKKVDVFFITLNKTDKEFSPTTKYSDYAIPERLFHWQSQSTTSEKSPTGQRYIHHKEMGSNIFLFVRENKNDRYGAVPFTFIGPAEFVSSEGSYPMNIIWRLQYPIPSRFIKEMTRGIAL